MFDSPSMYEGQKRTAREYRTRVPCKECGDPTKNVEVCAGCHRKKRRRDSLLNDLCKHEKMYMGTVKNGPLEIVEQNELTLDQYTKAYV